MSELAEHLSERFSSVYKSLVFSDLRQELLGQRAAQDFL